jgi:nucleoside-diphosphate-sugar epimerase
VSSYSLVTGATGFIGSHLVEALVARGDRVSCLVRPASRRRWPESLPVRLVPGDLADSTALAAALPEVTHVYHVAGLVKAPCRKDYFGVNAAGTRRLLDLCARHAPRLERFVLVSSLAAAGPAPAGRPRTEDDPPRPVSAYGQSKLAAEMAALAAADRLPVTIVRPCVVYGPRDTESLLLVRCIARGIGPLLGNLERISLIHVRDAVRGLLLAAAAPRAIGRTYFLAHPAVHTARDLLAHVATALGTRPCIVSVPYPLLAGLATLADGLGWALGRASMLNRSKVHELAARCWTCDPGRARAELGFNAQVALDAGLAETVAWYRRTGWL